MREKRRTSRQKWVIYSPSAVLFVLFLLLSTFNLSLDSIKVSASFPQLAFAHTVNMEDTNIYYWWLISSEKHSLTVFEDNNPKATC